MDRAQGFKPINTRHRFKTPKESHHPKKKKKHTRTHTHTRIICMSKPQPLFPSTLEGQGKFTAGFLTT